MRSGGLYSKEVLSEPPLREAYDVKDGLVASEEFARQIVDIDSISSISKKTVLYKLWLT